MADKTSGDEVQVESQAIPEEGDDTEGHLIMPNIAAARAMSSGRTQDGQRTARVRARETNERPGEKRNR